MYFEEDVAPAQYKDLDGTMLVEIIGTHAVMPPSPDKHGRPRYYLNDGPVTPTEGIAAWARLLAAVGLIRRHWPGHGRHNLLVAIAGFFVRLGVPEADALAALEEITLSTEGEVWRDCAPAVRDSYTKLAAGAAVTGGPTISTTLGDAVAARLRSWWISDLRARTTDELNATYFVATVGCEATVGCDADGDVAFKTERSMRLRFANQKVKFTKSKKEVFETKYEIWKQHPHRREYRKVVFAPPPYPCDPRDFNLWRGFGVRPLIPPLGDPARSSCETLRAWADREATARCALFLELTRDVICAGHDDHFRFLIDHLAQTVQFPGRPGGIAVS